MIHRYPRQLMFAPPLRMEMWVDPGAEVCVEDVCYFSVTVYSPKMETLLKKWWNEYQESDVYSTLTTAQLREVVEQKADSLYNTEGDTDRATPAASTARMANALNVACMRRMQDAFISSTEAAQNLRQASRHIGSITERARRRNYLPDVNGLETDWDWWKAIKAGVEGLYSEEDPDWAKRVRVTMKIEQEHPEWKLWKWNKRLKDKWTLPPIVDHEESLIVIGKSKGAAAYVQHNNNFKKFIEELVPVIQPEAIEERKP